MGVFHGFAVDGSAEEASAESGNKVRLCRRAEGAVETDARGGRRLAVARAAGAFYEPPSRKALSGAGARERERFDVYRFDSVDGDDE